MTTISAVWHNGDTVPSATPGRTEIDPRGHEGWDLHVIRGSTSLPLRSILLLQEDNGTLTRANAAALPADVAGITFLGQFAGGMANNVLSGGGVSVNSQTGEVTANPSPPPPHLRSFLITTIVIRNAGGPLTGPPIRVHIHENVTEIWLTPSPLSIAGDGPGQRLTVLAHFDDDTIGDITHLTSAPAGPGLPPEPGFTWISDNNACVQPDANGRLTGVFGLSPATCTITATIRQPNWPARSASAQVRCIDEWANQPPGRNELHLLSGPGADAFAEVPNILLLPDGFLDTPEDQADFTTLVGLIVDRLNRNPSTTPFDVLEGAINYWSAFVPSRERGSSLLDDLFEFPTLFEGATEAAKNPVTRLTVAATATAGSASLDFGLPALVGELQPATHFTIDADATIYTTVNRVAANANVLRGVRFSPPLAVTATANSGATVIGRRQSVPIGVAATPGGADPWAMENLIHVVGLPVPAERIAHGATAVELQAKVTDWRTLYGARIEPARITALIYDVWARVLSDHRLADETDTAFGLAVGERPRAVVRQTEQGISWHPGRTQRTHIDKYLATLSFQGTVIGTTWTLLPGGGPAKDRDLVFILARGARFSGANRHGPEPIIALGLVDEENVRVRYGSGRSMQIVSHPLPRDRGGLPEVTNFVHATIAHEAAHSFGIDDEYGGGGTLPAGGTDELGTFSRGNLSTESEITDGAGGIGGGQLRWRWPRINSAGVLAGPPVPDATTSGAFKITLAPGRAGNLRGDIFNVDDIVYLRQRPLFQPPKGNPPRFTPALESPPLRVVAKSSDVDLQLRLEPGGALNPADFTQTGPNAPILFRPDAASAVAAAAGDRYAEVMAQFIRAHISTTGGPLNAPAATPLSSVPATGAARPHRADAGHQSAARCELPGRSAACDSLAHHRRLRGRRRLLLRRVPSRRVLYHACAARDADRTRYDG